MKPDNDYLKALLGAFQESPAPTTDIRQLKKAGIDYEDEKFAFHMEYLADRGCLEAADGKPGLGLDRGADNSLQWSVIPLRLTAQGHHFATELRAKSR